MRILTRLGGICAVLAFFFPWLAFPQADPDFPGFYSYTPFRLMGNPGILPNQTLAAAPLLLVPIGALMLTFMPLREERITRNTRLALSRGARVALVIGNALVLLPVLNFYMLAFGQRNYPSAPDFGFWATVFALLLTLSGLARALYVSRQQSALSTPLPAKGSQNEQSAAVLSMTSSVQPAQEMVSQDG